MAVINVMRDPTKTHGPVYTAVSTTGRKVFTVLLDAADDADAAPIVAAGAAGVPSIFSSWSAGAPGLRCVQKQAEPLDGLKLWAVICEYATGPQSEDPLDEPPDVSYDSISLRDQWEYGTGGVPIVNSAGEPLKIEAELELSLVRIGRNVETHSLAQIALYRDSVNSAEILGAPVGTLWMKTYRASKVIRDDSEYWREEMEIAFNHLTCPEPPERSVNRPANGYIGWMHRVANTGRRHWSEDEPPELMEFTEKGGEPRDAVALSMDGTAEVAADQTIWIYFQTKQAVDWTPLGLSLD